MEVSGQLDAPAVLHPPPIPVPIVQKDRRVSPIAYSKVKSNSNSDMFLRKLIGMILDSCKAGVTLDRWE
jgi:hypothetical protein